MELRPAVRFDRVADSEITLESPNRGQRVHVWELWFANRPVARGKDTTARRLTARVEFCDESGRVVKDMIGQWAETQMPEHVGWVGLKSQIDLPPVHTWAKLLLIAQNTIVVERMVGDASITERGVYALAGENLYERPTSADHPDYFLPVAVTRARVVLAAENMDEREFMVRIERQPDGAVTGVSTVAS